MARSRNPHKYKNFKQDKYGIQNYNNIARSLNEYNWNKNVFSCLLPVKTISNKEMNVG